MKHELRKLLFDIFHAASDIEDFISDNTFEEFEKSALLQAAVERKFEIIGEALNRMKVIDCEFIERITEHRKIIGFRNVIAHGYDVIETDLTWSAIKDHLPKLKQEVSILLDL